MAHDQIKAALAASGITPEVFATQPDARTKLTPQTQAALRALAEPSAASGKLSPLGYNLTISHQHRFLWFRVAKVGTRTILGHFADQGVVTEVNHAMRMRYPTALFDDYTKFAFVRHPMDRFISAWRNKVVDNNYFGFDEETLAGMQRIEEFARWTADQDLTDLAHCDQHLALQTRLIDLTQVDILGRLENFDVDFAAICARLGIPATRPVPRNQSAPHPLTRATASQELASLVKRIYRQDFSVFGY